MWMILSCSFLQIQSGTETSRDWCRRKTIRGSHIVRVSGAGRWRKWFFTSARRHCGSRCSFPLSLCLWCQTAPHSEKSASTSCSNVTTFTADWKLFPVQISNAGLLYML